MRLPRLCRRRYVVVLLGLITAMSVFWTYWIESRLQLDSESLPNGFQSTRHETTKFLRLEEGNFQEIELARKREESGVDRTPWPVLGYTVTTKVKVAKKITEIKLLQRLKKLEENKLQRQSEVLLVNSLDLLRKDVLETFQNTFEVLGYKVILLKETEKSVSEKKEWQGLHRWYFSGKMGGNASVESTSFQRDDLLLLQENQRVSPVPGIEKLLLRNDGFCYLMSASKHVSAFKSKPISPRCFVLPAQAKLLLQDIKEGRGQFFTLKSLDLTATPFQNWGQTTSSTSEKINVWSEAVIQSFPADGLLIEGKAVIVQVYALVTSVSPLRVYRHNEGHIYLQRTEERKFVASEKWNLDKFFKHLESNFGENKASEAMEWMDDLIVKMLLLLEPTLVTYLGLTGGNQFPRCKQCFQALEITFTFSSSLSPFILEVKSPAFAKVSPRVVQDTVNILFNMSSIPLSHDIYQSLEVMVEKLVIKVQVE